MNPSGLTFASQPQATLSTPQTVTVTDTGTGNAPLVISGLTIGGADPGDFLVGGDNCRAQLQPGSSCQASIFFAPQGLGARSAELVVSSNDANGPQTVSLDGTGASGATGPATGPAGATGARGPRGPAGRRASAHCTVSEHGAGDRVICTVRYARRAGVVHAALRHGRHLLARARGAHASRRQRIVLRTSWKLVAGRYTLTLRNAGIATQTITITIT